MQNGGYTTCFRFWTFYHYRLSLLLYDLLYKITGPVNNLRAGTIICVAV
jgi:hypothetical protein